MPSPFSIEPFPAVTRVCYDDNGIADVAYEAYEEIVAKLRDGATYWSGEDENGAPCTLVLTNVTSVYQLTSQIRHNIAQRTRNRETLYPSE